MYPKLWEESKLPLKELLDQLILISIERYIDQQIKRKLKHLLLFTGLPFNENLFCRSSCHLDLSYLRRFGGTRTIYL